MSAANRYKAVAKTYVSHWFPILVLAIYTLVMGAVVVASAINGPMPIKANEALNVLWMPGLLFLFVGHHLKDQIAAERSRVVPGFVVPHVVVALCLTVSNAVLVSAVGWSCAHLSLMGGLALMAAMWGLAWWVTLCMSGPSFMVMMMLCYGLYWPPYHEAVASLLTGEHPYAIGATLLVGVGAAMYGLVSLLTMTEENPAYHRRFMMNRQKWSRRALADAWERADRSPWRRLWRNRAVDRLRPGVGASVRLWRLASPARGLPLAFAAGAILMSLLMWYQMGDRATAHGILRTMVFWLPLIPAAVMAGELTRRRKVHSSELLRPVSRRRYGQLMIGGSLRLATEIWGGIALAVLALLPMLPEGIDAMPQVIPAIILSAALLLPVCAATLWLDSFNVLPTYIFVMFAMVLASPAIGLTAWVFEAPPSLWITSAIIVAVALIGLLMLRAVEQRWTRVEFG